MVETVTGGASTSSAEDWVAVTPSDTANLEPRPRGLYIGGSGNVRVQSASGNIQTFFGVAAGTVLGIRPVRVLSTSTTATNILALY